MTTLLHSLGDYMVLTIKMFKNIYGKKYDHETINKFSYILPAVTPQNSKF
jgi:hypothetical protein